AGLRTREAILEASRSLFLRQGYHATGMREIARESGISLGAVYNHFPSKEEIFAAILLDRNVYRAIAEGLSRARGDTAAQLLESGFVEVMAMLKGKSDFPLLLFIDFLEFQGRHIATLVSEVAPEFLGFFQRVHLLGEEGSQLRRVSPVLMARTYIGMIFSSFIIEDVLGSLLPKTLRLPLYVENWEQGMVDILLHGVLKPTPGQEG
ncbi:MAG: TetR/AcrR family transcriptional regulator, partial [Chloroflexota bacterium]